MVSPTVSAVGQFGLSLGGYAIAGPVGGLAGSFLGNILFGGGPDVEGPRLDDREVASSAYNSVIARGYGVSKMTGQIIWATEIEEDKDTDKVGDVFGFGGTKVTEYKYFANIAVAFGAGPAAAIHRIWAGNKLIYDNGRVDFGSTEGSGLFSGETVRHLLKANGHKIRTYLGTEDQEPDPFMVEKIEDETGESNATPAHRGIVYAMIVKMPLEDFGNQIPPIVAEVNWLGQEEQPVEDATLLAADASGLGSPAIDLVNGYAYTSNGSEVRKIRLVDMTEEFQETDVRGDGGSVSVRAVTRGGFVAGDTAAAGFTNKETVFVLDPDTLKIAAQFVPTGANVTSNSQNGFELTGGLAAVSLYTKNTRKDYVLHRGTLGAAGVLEHDRLGESLDFVWAGGVGSPRTAGVTGGKEEFGFCEAWWTGHDTTPVATATISRLRIESFAEWNGEATLGVAQTTFDIDATEFHVSDSINTISSPVWVPGEDGVLFSVDLTPSGENWVALLDPSDGSLKWKTQISNPRFNSQARAEGDEFTFMSGSTTTTIRLSDGEVVNTQTGWNEGAPSGSSVIYDSRSEVIYLRRPGSSEFFRLYLNKASNQLTLDEVVEDLCQDAGLAVSEIDASELTSDIVRGYVISRQTTFRDALEVLASTYLFDAVESDFKLAFKKRGRSPTRTINEEDLIPLGGGQGDENYVERRTQDVELPRRLTATFFDVDRDGDLGTQSVQRVKSPETTMQSENEVTMNLPLYLTAAETKGIIQSLLYAAWTERVGLNMSTDWSNVDLDPGDVVNLARLDGTIQRVRLNKLDFGANLEIEMEAAVEETSAYTTDPLTDGGRIYRRFDVPASSLTKLALADMPLLEDKYDLDRAATGIFWDVGGLGIGKWPGADVFQSGDGIIYTFTEHDQTEMEWGTVLNDVGDTDLPFQTDDVNTVEVFMRNGTLSAITQAEMLAGGNRALLIDADGSVEIIHFQAVAEDYDVPGRYTLSTLLRGRRGTEGFTGGHAIGTLFVMAPEDTLNRLVLALSEIGGSRFYRAVGIGGIFADAPAISQTLVGRDLKPYAPTKHEATGGPLGNADVTLTWERRTRVGGADIVDGTGTVPLAEDTEEYELEIRPQADGVVLRTVTDLTDKTYEYTTAQQAADFDAPYDYTSEGMTNPGAEEGDTSGWTEGQPDDWSAVESAGSVTPRSGDFMFQVNAIQTVRELGQVVDLSQWSVAIAEGDAVIDASVWIADPSGSDNDTGSITVEYFDSDDNSLGSDTSGLTDPASTSWQQISATGTIPAATSYVVVTLTSRRNSGSVPSTVFDDVTITIDPDYTDTFAFTVYQVSEQVGRGFAGTGTVELITT